MKHAKGYVVEVNGSEFDYSEFTIIELEVLKRSMIKNQKFEEAAMVRELIKTQQQIDRMMADINAPK